jgi:hypothetical protein
MLKRRLSVVLLLSCSTRGPAQLQSVDAGPIDIQDAAADTSPSSDVTTMDAGSAVDIQVFDPVFPSEPAPDAGGGVASDGTVYVATDLVENGAAITSLLRDGFEYVVNEPPSTPNYIRGVSFQGTFFFDGEVLGNGTSTYYNDCNNPLETGGVADTLKNFGLTSPTRLWSPGTAVLQSRAQLAFYVDPNAPTDWIDPNDYTIAGKSPTCLVGKINNPQFGVHNNTALSSVFLGKTVHVGDIGVAAAPRPAAGVVAVDMVLATSKAYSFAGLHTAFAGVPSALDEMLSYDMKARVFAAAPSFGRNPIVATSADRTHALGVYTPQIALADEDASATHGYLPNRFSTGVNTLMPYIRYERIEAGQYKFKAFYLAGTLLQVQASMDALHATFKVLDRRVFDWKYYVTQASVLRALPSASEDQARLHWLTQGIGLGLRGRADFSIKEHLAANPELSAAFGTRYFAALLDYLK